MDQFDFRLTHPMSTVGMSLSFSDYFSQQSPPSGYGNATCFQSVVLVSGCSCLVEPKLSLVNLDHFH